MDGRQILCVWKLGGKVGWGQFQLCFFTNRTQRVKVGDTLSQPVETHRGGPQGSVITLIAWIIYINDVAEEMAEQQGTNLFIDDLSLLVKHPKKKGVLEALNKKLDIIYKWAQVNEVIFSFEKFNLIDLGSTGRRLSKKCRATVYFGPSQPPWSKQARYLGVTIDHKLNFRKQISAVTIKVQRAMKRLQALGGRTGGSSPEHLERMFKMYILPHYLYGSNLWIFWIYENFKHGEPVRNQYGGAWKELQRTYHFCARKILGVNKKTSGEACLVRLGWLSLDYLLAYHALRWFLKAHNGKPETELRQQWEKMADKERLKHSQFYRPAQKFLSYLNGMVDIDLYTCGCAIGFEPFEKSIVYGLD